MKIAIVCADNPGHTGMQQVHGLKSMGYVVDHFTPLQIEQVPDTGYDFYYYIDNSEPFVWPRHLKPLVFFCGDPQIDMGVGNWRLTMAYQSAALIVPHSKGQHIFADYGLDSYAMRWWWSYYWSGSADAPHPRLIDVEHISNLTCNEKVAVNNLLAKLSGEGVNTMTGQQYDPGRFRSAMASSKIGVQVNSMPHNDHYPNRPLEIMATGQLLIKQRLATDEFDKYFAEGEDFLYFDDIQDLEAKIRHYLKNEEQRLQIASSGQKKVQYHEFEYKASGLLDYVISQLGGGL